MSASHSPSVEVVRTDAGYHARIRSRNGRITWTTEVYTTRSGAVRAIKGISASTITAAANRRVVAAMIGGTRHPVVYLDLRLSRLAPAGDL